jgi:hypothetical protein
MSSNQLSGAFVGAPPRGGRDVWRRGVRKVVVHYHIFKNAGTSVDAALAASLPTWRDWTEGPAAYLRPDDLAAYLADRPSAEALSCHTLRPPAPAGFDVFPIILLRHPLDRAYSAYLHERRCAPNTLSCQIARATDFAGYVRWCLDHQSDGGIVICNYQTIHLGDPVWRDHLYTARAGDAELARALDLLESLPTPGVVDRFEAFMMRLQRDLNAWRGGSVELPPPTWENRSEDRNGSLGERLYALAAMLGPTLHGRFEVANKCDTALYRRAEYLQTREDCAFAHGRT